MATDPAAWVPRDRRDEAKVDRLEFLASLISTPTFDPVFRAEVIRLPGDHPVYGWACAVERCERPRKLTMDLCPVHADQSRKAKSQGVGRAEFLAEAAALDRWEWDKDVACRICPGRPAVRIDRQLCRRHDRRWLQHQDSRCAARPVRCRRRYRHPVSTGADSRSGSPQHGSDAAVDLGLAERHGHLIQPRAPSRPGEQDADDL
jgi:hypothetical protein